MMVPGIRARQLRRELVLTITAGLCCFATACSDTVSPGSIELKGNTVPVGNGTARTFVVESTPTHPTEVGIELSTAALDGLPAEMAEWTLPMPAAAATPPWDHVTINWNPQGHEPVAIYGVPHFDFHFYTITAAEQMQIAGGPDDTPVPAENIPEDYSSQVVSVPMMGVHWADNEAAEFHGSPFDKTFIYGFYHGDMVFVEPMVTKAMLASQPNAAAPVKQPQSFQKSGFYPDEYSIRYDAANKTVRITLESLRLRS